MMIIEWNAKESQVFLQGTVVGELRVVAVAWGARALVGVTRETERHADADEEEEEEENEDGETDEGVGEALRDAVGGV